MSDQDSKRIALFLTAPELATLQRLKQRFGLRDDEDALHFALRLLSICEINVTLDRKGE